ncbi:MAG: hypothetical protein K2M79_06585 [Muribaculaceae bacterium]|nr:hypothetical protein [Muribaculaceae bacterium]
MKLKLKLLPALLTLVAAIPASAKESEEPIITFHTTLYENAGAANAFHFYIGTKTDTYVDVDFGFGKTEVEVSQAVFDPSSSGIQATTVTGSVGEEGTVRIYGDASLVDYLDLEGVYITDLDISALTNLEILNLKHNVLKSLDLSGMSKLQAVYLNDNPFNVTPLKIGGNKPDLTILEMSICGAIDQSFNLSDYPNIVSFDAYATKDLRKLDPTNCPELLKLSIDCTSVTSLDISKNNKLLILNVSETGIKNLDLSHTPYLTELYCSNGSWMNQYKFDTLDLSKLPNLKRLFCADNNLTQLDLSKNPLLTDLSCAGNLLTSLDISNNPDLLNLSIYNNYMDFTTMPLPRPTFIEYVYNQKPMLIQRSYPVDAEFDFSSRVILPDSETWFALFAHQVDQDGNHVMVELTEDYYTYKDGKVKLLKPSADSLTMAFANSLFPEYDLKTTNFMVKTPEEYGKDNKIVSMRVRPTTKQLALSVGISGATPENPKRFSVDFGDGVPKDFTTTSDSISAEPNASGAVVKASQPMVVYIPEGEDLTAFGMEGINLVSVDLSAAPALKYLKLVKCQLSSVDMSYNRNLNSVDISHNNIQTINLCGRNDVHDKYGLRYFNASNNRLTSVYPGFYNTQTVDLSNNQLSDIDLSKASGMVDLNLSNNKFTQIAIQDLESIKRLDLSGNELSNLIIADYINPDYLNLSGNCFPISTLPQNPAHEYIYAPQKQWAMPEKAPTANLTRQLLDSATVFTWYKTDGTVISGDGIKELKPGVFQLADTDLGSIYCSFTNPAFPDFTGENTYRTTDIEVAPMPDYTICTFHTLAEGLGEITLRAKKNNTLIYMDWEGNGALEEFMTGTTHIPFQVNVHADVDVKMYSYTKESGLDVVSIGAGPLESIDAGELDELKTFAIYGSGLTADKMVMPASEDLTELTITGAEIYDLDIIKGMYPELRLINLSNNNLTECDFSEWKKLQAIYVNTNNITSATFDNPAVWDLGIAQNKLTEIDLSGLPGLDQLWIYNNDLHTIDISGNPVLRILELSGNRFDFNTLPTPKSSFNRYIYKDQKPVEAELEDGYRIDLSGFGAQTFRWFIDTPYIEEDGGLNGEELIEGKEYTIENGVTTFLKNINNVMCVMQNEEFPQLYLYTDFMDVRGDSGIEEITIEDNGQSVIYDLQGRRVAHPVNGVYIINGRKIYVR